MKMNTQRWLPLLVLSCAILLATGLPLAGQASDKVTASLGKLPVHFIENRGVFPDKVKFYVQGKDKTLFFTNEGITFRLSNKDRSWVVKLGFVDANPEVVPRGEEPKQGVISYFKGPEKDWKTGLPTFGKVVYDDLWPGIDLVYMGTVNRLKYEFVVRPGADPCRIRLQYMGAEKVYLTEEEAIRVETPVAAFEDAPPEAWQETSVDRVPVKMAYAVSTEGDFGFEIGPYDTTKTLVLDPVVLISCGYVGGGNTDSGRGIAVDSAGNIYLTGYTNSDQTTFPHMVGPDLTYNGSTDAFVIKLNFHGRSLAYCGYIGGVNHDSGRSIAVDAAGNAYVTGYTASHQNTFPVRVGPDVTHNLLTDAFVAKVNAQGNSLDYCGYIGGADGDYGYSIAVDASGNAYVTGLTGSSQSTFPVLVGPDLTYNDYGSGDAFVAKVRPTGVLAYCGYIGGLLLDSGYGISVDAAGNAYVTGLTDSSQSTFPVKVGPDLTYNNGRDAFVAKVNVQGTALTYCGYIGGSSNDSGYGISVDSAGNAYVTGDTSSDQNTFPVTVGPDLTYNGGINDAFVAKVSAQGNALAYCGFIGGSYGEYGYGIAVDAAGNAYVTGETGSSQSTFPVLFGPDLTHNGSFDAFVANVNTRGTALGYCGYIGGSISDSAYGISVDSAGNAYVTGDTSSDQNTFPVKTAHDITFNGLTDAFVAKVSCHFPAAFNHDPVYLVGGYYPTTSTLYATGIQTLSVPETGSPRLSKLCQPGNMSYGFAMDADNRQVVFTVVGSTSPKPTPNSGLFRYNPSFHQISTIYAFPTSSTRYFSLNKLCMDYNGDYVFVGYENPGTHHRIWRVDHATRQLTTLVSTVTLGRSFNSQGVVQPSIDSGKILYSDISSSSSYRYPVLEVDENGTVNSWNTGATYGWKLGYYGAPLNHRTGWIEGPDPNNDVILRLKPGSQGLTTVTTITGWKGTRDGMKRWDLQTAANPRIVAVSHYVSSSSTPQGWLYYIDGKSWTLISMSVSNQQIRNYDFDFYRGRHIQTVRTAPRKWDIRVSCPLYAKKAYALVAGITGVRPGIAFPDGRNLNLNYDVYTHMTLWNVIPTIFNPGPGVLNGSGEAVGKLDLTAFPARFGIPFWIAVVVLDPAAPFGIAYLPDTHVMRI